MQMETASRIFRLLPGNIVDLCKDEYSAVRGKCNRSSRFTHEGVNVRVTGNADGIVTVEFSVPGYKVVARDVSLTELDGLFGLGEQG